MTDAVTTQTILDGGKKVIMKFTNVSDATGEAAVTKVDVSTLSNHPHPTLDTACDRVTIQKIRFTTAGMSVKLLWDATSDELIAEIPTDEAGCLDYTAIGGLKNPDPAGVTGDINFTTVGAGSGDSYSIVLEMTKHFA